MFWHLNVWSFLDSLTFGLRVAKCQILYTDKNLSSKFTPKTRNSWLICFRDKTRKSGQSKSLLDWFASFVVQLDIFIEFGLNVNVPGLKSPHWNRIWAKCTGVWGKITPTKLAVFTKLYPTSEARMLHSKILPQIYKKITQIYLPYLWHFTTLTKPHSVMASLQKSLQSPISIWWIVNFVPKCFLLFLWPFKSSPLNGWHDGLWILDKWGRGGPGDQETPGNFQVTDWLQNILVYFLLCLSPSPSHWLIAKNIAFFSSLSTGWFSFFVSLCHVCGFSIEENKVLVNTLRIYQNIGGRKYCRDKY